MRKKTSKKQEFDVADGLNFESNISVSNSNADESQNNLDTTANVDPTRSYSKYYKPKPRKGARGGTLGRGPVSEENRKTQFSLTCTKQQRARFQEAAKNENRNLSNFICLAVEEYIKNHDLL